MIFGVCFLPDEFHNPFSEYHKNNEKKELLEERSKNYLITNWSKHPNSTKMVCVYLKSLSKYFSLLLDSSDFPFQLFIFFSFFLKIRCSFALYRIYFYFYIKKVVLCNLDQYNVLIKLHTQ